MNDSENSGRRLVTRKELAHILGYTLDSLNCAMSREKDRWPSPVSRGRGRSLLYDLAQFDDFREISDQEDLIECLECGVRVRMLGSHLRAHRMSMEEYRRKHQIPDESTLVADVEKKRMVDQLTASHVAARDRREMIVQEHGFSSFQDAIEKTCGMTLDEASRATGASKSTIYYYRKKMYPRAEGTRADVDSWTGIEMRATRLALGMSVKDASLWLGVHSSTISMMESGARPVKPLVWERLGELEDLRDKLTSWMVDAMDDSQGCLIVHTREEDCWNAYPEFGSFPVCVGMVAAALAASKIAAETGVRPRLVEAV